MTTSIQTQLRFAAQAGFIWAAFQVAMMVYSGNLSTQTALINVVPVVLLSAGTWRASRVAALGLASYGLWRLWMAYPVLVQLGGDNAMPKHWWIALLAIPFAMVWIGGAYGARWTRKA
ncbi:MAG TPA: hypothetical protein VF128_13045 [Gemmatimonadaceae bacterium]